MLAVVATAVSTVPAGQASMTAYLDVLEDLEQAQHPEGPEDANASESFCGHIQYLAQVDVITQDTHFHGLTGWYSTV